MKLQAVVGATLTIAVALESATAMPQFLQELPNGSLFKQDLGHPGDDSSQQTDFAQAFDNAGQSWTKDLCQQKFPGSSMTNGEAFGDPCCTWKKGGKPDFTVTPFTTSPTKATTCASGGASDATKGSSNGDSDATKGETGGSSNGGASDATKGDNGASEATKGSSNGASDATKGWTPSPASGNTWGSTPSPSMRCNGKAARRD